MTILPLEVADEGGHELCWRQDCYVQACIPSSASPESEISPSVFAGSIVLSLKASLMAPCPLYSNGSFAIGIHGSGIQNLSF